METKRNLQAMENKLIVVLGPTASGKTKYAVSLAHKLGTEIISADSRQIYRGMDIGTGKDLADYVIDGRQIPYHLIDIAEAGTKYDIFHFQRDFAKAYKDITSRGLTPILCGGSGLYIESVTRCFELPEVPANPELRERLEQQDEESLKALLCTLTVPHNVTEYDTRKRLIRAIEIATYIKEHPEDQGIYSTEGLPKFAPGEVKYIGIKVDRDERNARIDRRLDARLKEGMIDEVKGLLDSGIPAENLIYYGLEYKFVTLYLTGEMTYDEMRGKLAIAIHQFAKRQMTWFRGMERRGIEIEWIDPFAK